MTIEHAAKTLLSFVETDWYAKKTGLFFPGPLDAVVHYVKEGEAHGFWPNRIFDPSYYRSRNRVDAGCSALEHFVTLGYASRANPNAFFDIAWYEWQNPDFHQLGNGVLHYLSYGGQELRDPAPWVDMVAAHRQIAQPGDSGCDIVHSLSCGDLSLEGIEGVTRDVADLSNRQKRFFAGIEPQLTHAAPGPVNGNNLLFVQCAEGSNFWSWFDAKRPRDWDVALNCYAGTVSKAESVEYVCEQKGTKFTGMYNWWRFFRDIFDRYETVFFVDDDLVFNFDDLSVFFDTVQTYDLDLAQPSLSAGSFCSWDVFFHKGKGAVRPVNGVEIMMPALSKRAREVMLPFFMLSVSGFGLDLLMAQTAQTRNLRAGIVDEVIVDHRRAISQTDGAFYEFLRKHGLNSKFELWRLQTFFELDRAFREVA